MKKYAIAAILLFAAVYIAPLGIRPIAMISEARYGVIPGEMLASGDWIVPRLNGLLYFEKPPLGYWLNACSMRVFGNSPLGIRLPTALAAGATALCLYLLAFSATRSKRTALLASAIYLSFLLTFMVNTIALLDGMLTLFVTASIVALYYASQADLQKKRLTLLSLAGICMGAAFMTKGFLGLLLPALAIAPWLVWQKDTQRLLKLPWIPLGVAGLVCLPWAIAIHLQQADFWPYFFWEEHVNRFLPDSAIQQLQNTPAWNRLLGPDVTERLVALDTQHAEPFFYFLPILAIGAMPWTPILPAAFMGLWKTRHREPIMRLCLCWFLLPLLFFSLSSGKLAPYILPCLPPLALLCARGIVSYFGTGNRRAFTIGACITALIALLAALALAANHLTHWPEPLFAPDERLRLLGVLAGLLTLAALATASVLTRDTYARLALFTWSPALLFILAQGSLPRSIRASESAQYILDKHEHIARDAVLAGGRYTTHSLCLYYERDDVYLFNSFGEFRYGLAHEDNRRHISLEAFHEWISQNNRPVFMLLEKRHYRRHRDLFEPFAPYTHSHGRLTVLFFEP